MRILILTTLALATVSFLFPTFPVFADPGYSPKVTARDLRGRDLVREPDLRITETVSVPGFWRPRHRSGYHWIEAAQDEVGRWHAGYWEPINLGSREVKITHPGYWGPAGRYGHIWIKNAERIDHYRAGSWKLMNSFELREEPRKWVPGYWDQKRWVAGYWRAPKKGGYIWVAGYFRLDGRRQEAGWVEAPDQS